MSLPTTTTSTHTHTTHIVQYMDTFYYSIHININSHLFHTNRHNQTSWEAFHLSITERELYPANNVMLQRLLHDMATTEIVHVGK